MKIPSLATWVVATLWYATSSIAQHPTHLRHHHDPVMEDVQIAPREDDARILSSTPFEVPFTVSPFQATDYLEKSDNVFGNCARSGFAQDFDAQTTSDPVCQTVDDCHLGWTEAGEFVMFEFTTSDEDNVFDWVNNEEASIVTVTVRVASNNPNRRIQLQIRNELDEEDEWPTKVFETPGEGWQSFQDVTWNEVPLSMEAIQHQLFVTFLDGSVNLCAITVRVPRIAPFRASAALEFDDNYEADSVQDGKCNEADLEKIDAQPTQDLICQARDGSSCNIGWTKPGEWASYDFTTLDSEDYRVWARIASGAPNKRVRLELEWTGEDQAGNPLQNVLQSSYEFEAPGLGWQAFVDVGFNVYLGTGSNYRLKVSFLDGSVNLCSAGVDFMAQWGVGEFEYPITFNALDFDDAIDSNPDENIGDCPVDPPAGVDARETQGDSECLATGPCHVAFAEPGEMVRYDFSTPVDFQNPRYVPTGPVVDVVLRVASQSSSRRIRLELDGNLRTLDTPGDGYNTFQDIVWEDVQLLNTFYHPLYVIFVDGQVNLCYVRIE